MNLLPRWVIPNKYPALLDTESVTVLEQTSRLYGAMQELIEEYNAFVDATNEKITEFMESSDKNYELFTLAIRQEFQDFIDVIELKLQAQDKEIADAINYMKKNLNATVTALVEKSLEDGDFAIGLHYDEESHGLNISVQGVV